MDVPSNILQHLKRYKSFWISKVKQHREAEVNEEEAEVIEAEVIEAEVIEAEAIEAEVIRNMAIEEEAKEEEEIEDGTEEVDETMIMKKKKPAT